jgi:outer membrane cobalamin receptor
MESFYSKTVFSLLLLIACCSISAAPARAAVPPLAEVVQQKHLATLRGRVVDARTGEPIVKVKVTVSGTDLSTTTGDNGAFTIENVPAGRVDLYITTVSYGLVKKSIILKQGDNADFQIVLNEDAAALTETVTVTADPYLNNESNAASEQTLNKRELQALSSVSLNDPVRAAQGLPGVTTNDDYRSDFAVRGAGFDRVGLYIDGMLADNFVHTIEGGHPDGGSISVINADTVDSVSLMSGAYSSRYGNRTAAILDVETRDGNRVKPTGRAAVSLSGLSGVIDGPFAQEHGSYLLAARKSYVGYILRRINDQLNYTNNAPILDLADFQGKALYDLTKRSQIGFSLIFGAFIVGANRNLDLYDESQIVRAGTRNLLVNGQWSYTPRSNLFWQTRVFALRSNFKNTNRNNVALEEGSRTEFDVRSDINFHFRPSHRLEAGLYVRSASVNNVNRIFDFGSGTFVDVGKLSRRGTEQSYYVQDSWSAESRGLSVTAGVRFEHSDVTGEKHLSPRGSLTWLINKDWRIRAGAGRHYQFPAMEKLFGRLGNVALLSERATHYNASVERLFGNRTRVLTEVYDREDTNLVFSLSEPRLTGKSINFAEFRFQNSLQGHARGIEITVQRRSANKLAGWFSYAYSRTQYTDTQSGLSFVSDFDQRHTVNVYGSYRVTETWNLSGAWRYGSGEPIPGFIRQAGVDYFLASERNLTRLPYYNRVDVRLSKAFLFKKSKLTLTGEVLNLLNRANVRYAGFSGYQSDGRVFGQLERVLPILPSAGVVFEF